MNLYVLITFFLITCHCVYADDIPAWNHTMNTFPNATIYIGSNCTQPIITGFQGQSFPFQGIPNEIFNLITSPHLHVNARFAYVEELDGCQYHHNTTCTRTYMGEIGIKAPQHRYHIITHPHQQGLQIKVNGHFQPINTIVSYDENRNMMDTSDDITVSIISHDRIEFSSPLFDIIFIHTNGFLNLIITLKDTEIYSAGVPYHHYDEDRAKYSTDNIYPFIPVHGLIGQTWRNAVYGAAKSPYEGEWDSYLIQPSKLFGTDCEFGYYEH